MSPLIISGPIPVDVAGDGVGSLEMRHVTSVAKDFYCFKWKIATLSELSKRGRDMSGAQKHVNVKSPLFKVPKKDQCKWYLSLDAMDHCGEKVVTFLNLVLDRESDCKEAFVKFNLFVIGYVEDQHNCLSELAGTFKFATKLQNSANVFSMQRNKSWHENESRNSDAMVFVVVCEIMIERIISQDDTFFVDFSLLLKNQLFADFVISVGEKTYPVHKLVLATRSPVLAAMLAHDVLEKKGVMRIEDIDENVFEGMLHYIYTGELRESEQSFEDLLIAADKYDLKGLRIRCEEKLILSLSSSNAFDVLLLAETYNAKDLKSAAMEFITNRRKSVVKTSAWESLWRTMPELMRDIFELFLQDRITA